MSTVRIESAELAEKAVLWSIKNYNKTIAPVAVIDIVLILLRRLLPSLFFYLPTEK